MQRRRCAVINPYVFAAIGVVLAVRIILGALDDDTDIERGEEDEHDN